MWPVLSIQIPKDKVQCPYLWNETLEARKFRVNSTSQSDNHTSYPEKNI